MWYFHGLTLVVLVKNGEAHQWDIVLIHTPIDDGVHIVKGVLSTILSTISQHMHNSQVSQFDFDSFLLVSGYFSLFHGETIEFCNFSWFKCERQWTCPLTYGKLSGSALPEEGLIVGRNVGDSALVSIYLHDIYLKL